MTEVKAELVGNLWKIVVEVGQTVDEDDTLMILQETPDEALRSKVVDAVRACPKQAITLQD